MLLGQKDILARNAQKPYTVLMALFALAVFLLPIDWIRGIGLFGEFSIMSSFYIFLPLVLMAAPAVIFHTDKRAIASELWWFVGLVSFSLLLSCAINMPDILSASLKGRGGLNKLVTTFITFYFGVALMFVTARLAQRPQFLKKSILPPLRIGLVLVFAACAIELAGWFVGAAQDVYQLLSKVFRSGYPELIGFDGRLRGVSGEPASMAVYLGFALVWGYGMIRIAKYKNESAFWGRVLFAGAIFFFVLSGARTAYLMLAGMIASLFVLPILMRFSLPKKHQLLSFSLFLLFCLAFTALFFLSQSNMIAYIVSNGDSVSNLSRYASNYTAFSLFAENPVVGVGPGQYAFKAFDAMPAWGWQSWEIRDWFTNPARTWPPIFSLPGRLASEQGMIGVLAWYIPLLELLRRLLFCIRKEYARLGQRIPPLGATLFLGMVYVLLQGVAQESFRFFELWIILGIVSAYVLQPEPETAYLGESKYEEEGIKTPLVGPQSWKEEPLTHER